jgi:solute carrier family 8 (sodium/calcium exchanger)
MKSGPCVLFVALLYVAPAVSQICNLNDPEGGGLFVPAFGSGGAHWCVNNSTENEPTVYVNPDGCENTHCATICVPAENDVQAWGVLYCVLLLWCFLGVGIIADKFMEAIGVVTSKSTLIEKEDKGTGQTHQYEIMTWNATVANLTLMALGSSAPEILLNVIEICSGGFYAGALGPGTIVGSAAFNLFIIIAVCVMVLPDGETRKIADMKVFGITAFSSVFAYLWLLIILMAWTPNVVTLEEAIITFLFFPLLVILAFMADKGVFSKRNSVAPSVLTGVAHIEHQYDDETGKLTKTVAAETFTPGQVKAALMKNHSLIKPGADPNLLAMEVFKKSKPMTRADYFNQAGRKLRGVKDTGMAVVTATEDRASRVGFKCTEWKESEGEESVTLTVQRFGYMKDALTVEYATESGSATAGADFLTVTGEAQFEPGTHLHSYTVSAVPTSAASG